jgi:acetyltransferase-like isoleucine patch superfamily enzyme
MESELKPIEELGGLKRLGKDNRIYRYAQIIKPAVVSIGNGCQIDDFAWVHGGQGLEIGDRVHICAFVSIAGGGHAKIGNYVGLSAGVRIISGSEDPSGKGLTNPCIPAEFRSVKRSFVEIGDHTLIFTNAIILPGAKIGIGAVIMPGATVKGELAPWGYYDGNPAVRVRDRVSNKILELSNKMVEKYGY